MRAQILFWRWPIFDKKNWQCSLFGFIYNPLVENNQHSLKDRELLLKLPSRPIQVRIHSLHHPDFQVWTICSSMDIVQCSKWKQMWLDSPRKLLIGMLTTFPQCNLSLEFPELRSQNPIRYHCYIFFPGLLFIFFSLFLFEGRGLDVGLGFRVKVFSP